MRISIVALMVLSMSAAACSGGGSSAKPVPGCTKIMPAGFPTTTLAAAGQVHIGDTAPDVALQDIDGNAVCLRDFVGKTVLISMGAGWCPPCRAETPFIEDTYKQYKAQGFEVLMPLYQDYQGGAPTSSFLDAWQQQFKTTFKLVPDAPFTSWSSLARPDDPNIPPGYLVIPLDVVLDRDQVVTYDAVGSFQSKAQVEGQVLPNINKPAVLDYTQP